MQTALEALRVELEQEAEATLRVLTRVPCDRLAWRPHATSMTLGQLALHVARIPAEFTRILRPPGLDLAQLDVRNANPAAGLDLGREFEHSLATAREWLAGLDDSQADAMWTGTIGDRVLVSAPRISPIRSLILNHWYHHRGQLCVYLRLLQIPVPAIYGASADENPFV